MKNRFSVTFILVVSMVLLVSLAANAADITMKIGHSHSVKAPRHKAVLRFKELVEERTDGKIEVKVYPSNQLGTEAEMLEAVKMGTIQATMGGQFEAASPKLLIYTMPFLFKDVESVYQVIRGPIGEQIATSAEKNGIKILATGVSGGLRNFTNNVRPIETPEDMKGLKMRTPPIDSIIKTMEAIGANPVSVPFSELYMGLKNGVADGQENPYLYIKDKKLYEVQKYLTVVNYQFHPSPIYASLDWYNSLSPKLQMVVENCAEEAMLYCDKLNLAANQEAFEFAKERMEVNQLTPENRQLFIDKAQAVYDYYIDEGYFTMEEINEVREAANK